MNKLLPQFRVAGLVKEWNALAKKQPRENGLHRELLERLRLCLEFYIEPGNIKMKDRPEAEKELVRLIDQVQETMAWDSESIQQLQAIRQHLSKPWQSGYQ